MIKFKNTKTALDIEYTKGDTFEFSFLTEDELPTGSVLRLQVSPNGDINDIIIEKQFSAENNAFVITLTDSDLAELDIDTTYQYRFTFFDIAGKKITTISGSLNVKWGA